jgi:hypothetical protein
MTGNFASASRICSHHRGRQDRAARTFGFLQHPGARPSCDVIGGASLAGTAGAPFAISYTPAPTSAFLICKDCAFASAEARPSNCSPPEHGFNTGQLIPACPCRARRHRKRRVKATGRERMEVAAADQRGGRQALAGSYELPTKFHSLFGHGREPRETFVPPETFNASHGAKQPQRAHAAPSPDQPLMILRACSPETGP